MKKIMFISVILLTFFIINFPKTIYATQIVNNAEDLILISEEINNGTLQDQVIVLNDDIDLSECEEWIPIGTRENPFKGAFNGNGYTISNIKCTSQKNNVAGLFGCNIGIIENVIVEGEFLAEGYVGGICAINNGIIFQCANKSKITSTVTGIAGGIVGVNGISNIINEKNNTYGKVMSCYSIGNFGYVENKHTEEFQYAGIVGTNNNGFITCCYANNDFEKIGKKFDGLVGFSKSGKYVKRCYFVEKENLKNNYGIKKNLQSLKSENLVEKLGESFISDTKNINDGLPILYWESKSSSYYLKDKSNFEKLDLLNDYSEEENYKNLEIDTNRFKELYKSWQVSDTDPLALSLNTDSDPEEYYNSSEKINEYLKIVGPEKNLDFKTKIFMHFCQIVMYIVFLIIVYVKVKKIIDSMKRKK